MTYNSLTSTVLQYLERSDAAVVAAIPTFITMCEFEIAQNIKTLGQMQVVDATMNIGNPIIAKPALWRKTVSMNITVAGVTTPVLLRKYEYLKNYWPESTETGVPLYYADTDWEHWYLAPTPNAAYSFEVLYYERVQPLDSSNQTNWFTIYAPQSLLYGSLLQAMPYLKNDECMGMWQQQYDLIINTLKNEDVIRIADRQANVQDS
jgi:hypothetical protein